jgi:hypothetical protein
MRARFAPEKMEPNRITTKGSTHTDPKAAALDPIPPIQPSGQVHDQDSGQCEQMDESEAAPAHHFMLKVRKPAHARNSAAR